MVLSQNLQKFALQFHWDTQPHMKLDCRNHSYAPTHTIGPVNLRRGSSLIGNYIRARNIIRCKTVCYSPSVKEGEVAGAQQPLDYLYTSSTTNSLISSTKYSVSHHREQLELPRSS